MYIETGKLLPLYRNYCQEITDAPEIYHEYLGMATIGAILKNKIYFPYGANRIYPNLWLILIGKSAFRKTTALNIARKIISKVAPEMIYPNDFSREGVIFNLSMNPQGIFFFSEFATLQGLLKREYNAGLQSFFADVFDCPITYHRYTHKHGKVEIKNPVISFISATTLSWFLTNLTENAVEGGFIPRFLIVPANNRVRTIPLPPPPSVDLEDQIIAQLRIYQQFSGVMYLSEGAKKEYITWYNWFSSFPEEKYSTFLNRLSIYLIKIAMILNLDIEQSLCISKQSMQIACQYTRWLRTSFIELYKKMGFSPFEKKIIEVKNLLESFHQLSKSELLQKTKYSKRILDEVLQTLVESKEIALYKEKGEVIVKEREKE